MTLKPLFAALSGAALAATLLLSGCGAPAESEAEEPAAEAPAESGTEEQPAETAAPEASAESDDSGESSEGRPSTEEVSEGLGTLLSTQGQEMPAEADKLIDCWAKLLVDGDMSDEGLQKVADGQPPTDQADATAFQTAISDASCITEASS